MQRPHLLAIFLVLGIAIAALVWFGRAPAAPPPPLSERVEVAAPEPDAAAGSGATAGATADAGARREAARPEAAGELDPEVRAALSGFRGRVVDHAHAPVAGCGVRIYRGALDSILPEGVDVFAAAPTLQPTYVAGETKTAADGTFTIDGVWPRAFYLLFAGIGTDAPGHRLLPRSPAPGETIDLGDIVLDQAAVVTGTVVDEEGKALPDALVRGIDLPGQLVAFLPFERFDPEGCLLVRER